MTDSGEPIEEEVAASTEAEVSEGSPPEEEEESKGSGSYLIGCLAFLGLVAVVAAITVPNFIRARARGQLTACKSNLKNIGTAMEMYSTDWSGKYPLRGKAQLTPNYLKTIPECPASGTDTYYMASGTGAVYNTGDYQDYYFIECRGDNHVPVSVPAGYPQYNGIIGLIER